MDNDLGSKISKISSLLENKDLIQSLAPLLSALTSNAGTSDSNKKPESEIAAFNPLDDFDADTDTDNNQEDDNEEDFPIVQAATATVSIPSAGKRADLSDSRIVLLNCLKPFCSPVRQQRVNTCIQIISLIKTAGLFVHK